MCRVPLPAVSQEDNTYEVDTILATRTTKGGKKEYLIHWKGYLYEEATWEPEENLKGSERLLNKFIIKMNNTQPDSDKLQLTDHHPHSSESEDEGHGTKPAPKRRQTPNGDSDDDHRQPAKKQKKNNKHKHSRS